MSSGFLSRCCSFYKESLAGRFVVLTVSTILVLMIMIVMINFHAQKKIISKNLREQTELLGNFVSSISPEAMLSYDYDALNNYMQEISNASDIIYAVILTPSGTALTSFLHKTNSYINEIILHQKNADILEIVSEVNKLENVYHQRFPIVYETRVLGYFEVGVDKSRVEAQIKEEMYSQLLIGAIFTLVFGIGIYLIFRFYTLKPINALAKGAERVTGGDLEHRVKLKLKDELGQLGGMFNDMVSELNKSNTEKDDVLMQLKHLNQTLEERVIKRTSELGEANQKLEKLAMHDSLTGLPNRNLIQIRLNEIINNSKKRGQRFTVIMMDLDRFKEVNDSLGHESGDKLLIEVANRLGELFRPQDLVGRLGGDEFAIVLHETGAREAISVSEKIHTMLEAPFHIENMSFSIDTSLGIAVYPEHGDSTSSLLKAADIAMYSAKNKKLGHAVYDPADVENSLLRLSQLAELRKAILDGGLELYYQPKFDLGRETVVGVEALLRWHHHERGFIPPDEFIPMAEQSGLIRQLTYWVISKAMEQCEIWQKAGLYIDVSINLSMYNLQDPEFPAQLVHILDNYDIDNKHIIFEITESTLMKNPEYVMSVLEQLGYYDFTFSIDDFGTGYSSLANLKRLPVQELKIDKSFVQDIAEDKDDAAIVQSIIDMAHNLGIKVVAEGVETVIVCDLLRKFSCDVIQGYLLSPPVPVDKVTTILKKPVLKLVESDVSNAG